MSDREKVISQLCIDAQKYCDDLREDYNILDESYTLATLVFIEKCIEKIRRMVDPEFDDICEAIEAAELEEQERPC